MALRTAAFLFFCISILPIEISCQQVSCFDCVAPRETVDLEKYCSEDKFCKGTYCFKGPDTTSSGILHGCIEQPPIESKVGTCKVYNASAIKENCYCKNTDFCNGITEVAGLLGILLVVGFLFW